MKPEEKCKVKGCKNKAMKKVSDNCLHPDMKKMANFGYCQIHQIEGLVKEVEDEN